MEEIKTERLSPSWNKRLNRLAGGDTNIWIINEEKSIEDSIIEILFSLGIQASVKSNRYSLPYKEVVSTSSGVKSNVLGSYKGLEATRRFVKELLEKDVRKVRFYVYIHATEDQSKKGIDFIINMKFNIEIRYYVHN